MIAIVALIIFVVVGVIEFILFILGLAINASKQFAQGAIDVIQSWFTIEADAYINEEDIVDLANYLEELEYDLIGYGFITPNPEFSKDIGILTHGELAEQGYIYFEKRGEDENARYYSQSAEEDPEGTSAYDGFYYNSLGIMIDNATGSMIDSDSYVDEYGIERSTEETSSNGSGKIVGFGNDFLSGLAGWTVDTKLLRTYLLSDYRIYSIRNDNEGLLANIFSGIKQTLVIDLSKKEVNIEKYLDGKTIPQGISTFIREYKGDISRDEFEICLYEKGSIFNTDEYGTFKMKFNYKNFGDIEFTLRISNYHSNTDISILKVMPPAEEFENF